MKGFILLLLLFVALLLITENLEASYEEKTSTGSEIENVVTMELPAVDENGNGVTATLIVEARPGKGRVLTDINDLLFFIDTQNSIQIAKDVAENMTGVKTDNIDLVYQIETSAEAIGGPSAGAAITLATIAVLENKTINSSVMITGTIEPDGSIGKVGAILEKAKAAKEKGAEVFLVPVGQSVDTKYVQRRECKWIGRIYYCETEYVAKAVNVTDSVGILVIEVDNIMEAMEYALV